METKNTKGPWNIHPHLGGEPLEVTGSDGESWTYVEDVIAKGDKVIARVEMSTSTGGFPKVQNPQEAKANAALIVAAPEMYDLLARFVHLDEDEFELLHDLATAADALINKIKNS
jgi:hypothetical protein